MAHEPQVELKQVHTHGGRAGQWRIRWSLKNLSRRVLRVDCVRFPHQQFKSQRHTFDPPVDLSEHATLEFEQSIRCEEPPGEVTENAFAIVYATWSDVSYRIFIRLKVVVDADGHPHTTTEWITVQKAGFSGVES